MRTFLLISILFLLWTGCSTSEESLSFDPGLSLVFSNDSVAFDTLLSERRSSTRRLTVYNPNEEAIQFSQILLGNQEMSDYSVILNGRETNSLVGERLNGGDSLLILVEVNVRARDENLPYLVKDSIIFRWNTNEEHVKLISYGQDVKAVSSESICNTIWTSDRPYFIDGVVAVEEGCTLTIEKGTEIYFYNNALLLIEGTMIAEGDSANHILFSSWRFDSGYDNVPGQWNGLIFLEESQNNRLSYCTIENADIALGTGYQIKGDSLIPGDIGNGFQSSIEIHNTTIRNASTAGLLAFNSTIEATNMLVYNCGAFLVGNFAGGDYTYHHCTITNEPSLFIQENPTIQFSDNAIVGEELLVDDLNIEMTNCILWGSQDEELSINNGGGASIFQNLRTNIIKSGQEIPDNFTSQEFNFPGFKDAFANNYELDTLAFAKDKGRDIGVSIDLTGRDRDENPDIGAYERVEKQ